MEQEIVDSVHSVRRSFISYRLTLDENGPCGGVGRLLVGVGVGGGGGFGLAVAHPVARSIICGGELLFLLLLRVAIAYRSGAGSCGPPSAPSDALH